MEMSYQLDNLQHHGDGEIYARCKTWRPDFPLNFVVAQVDMDRDCGEAVARLFTAAPALLKALRKIDALVMGEGLNITVAESPGRDLLYRMHTVAIQAIRGTE